MPAGFTLNSSYLVNSTHEGLYVRWGFHSTLTSLHAGPCFVFRYYSAVSGEESYDTHLGLTFECPAKLQSPWTTNLFHGLYIGDICDWSDTWYVWPAIAYLPLWHFDGNIFIYCAWGSDAITSIYWNRVLLRLPPGPAFTVTTDTPTCVALIAAVFAFVLLGSIKAPQSTTWFWVWQLCSLHSFPRRDSHWGCVPLFHSIVVTFTHLPSAIWSSS